ncbi:hypothetical protein COLO4_07257 [Corchorus olitorius]|uniref:Uncharacterized protein n=1 Tax=Corchorus olitorius TaxID=93759 RepID=A0A1R3KKB3_9ROSI|nr:hypothetical protein COLO4_07257 [Corchorus olitorius]
MVSGRDKLRWSYELSWVCWGNNDDAELVLALSLLW